MVTKLDSFEEFTTATGDTRPSVVYYSADWCGSCRVVGPTIEQLEKKYTNVSVYNVDVDEQPIISKEVGIRALPTVMAFKEGSKLHDIRGGDLVAIQKLFTGADNL